MHNKPTLPTHPSGPIEHGLIEKYIAVLRRISEGEKTNASAEEVMALILEIKKLERTGDIQSTETELEKEVYCLYVKIKLKELKSLIEDGEVSRSRIGSIGEDIRSVREATRSVCADALIAYEDVPSANREAKKIKRLDADIKSIKRKFSRRRHRFSKIEIVIELKELIKIIPVAINIAEGKGVDVSQFKDEFIGLVKKI